jgi:Primase C terminal 1 (PriCT-1)
MRRSRKRPSGSCGCCGRRKKTRANGSAAIGATTPEGRRIDTLTSLAGTMRRRGMGAEEIDEYLKGDSSNGPSFYNPACD